MSASIICDCGHKCTTKGVHTTTYTAWENLAVSQGRYRRTCAKCEHIRHAVMVAAGYKVRQVFTPIR